MPITPQQAADQRINSQVSKLEALIDRKLTEHVGDHPFTFQFHRDTSPRVIDLIRDLYQRVGWDAFVADVALKGSQENPFPATAKELYLRESGSKAADSRSEAKAKGYAVVTPDGKQELFYVGASNEGKKAEPKKPSPLKDTVEKPNSMIHRASNEEREVTLAECFKTEEGPLVLRKAMQEPIAVSVMYQCNSRKALTTHEDKSANYGVLTENSLVWDGDKAVRYADLSCFPISVTKSASLEMKSNLRYYRADGLQVKARDHIMGWECEALFGLLKAAVEQDAERTIHTYPETLERALADAFGEIDAQALITAKIFCHPRTYHRYMLRAGFPSGEFTMATQRDILMTGLYAHYRSADVHTDVNCAENEIYLMPPAQYLGILEALKTEDGVGFKLGVPHEDVASTLMAVDLEHTFSALITNPQYVRRIKIRP